MIAWLLILLPLALYLVAYTIEAYLSWRRLGSTKPDDPYTVATWGITHTLLVVAVAYFFIIFSANLDQIASAAFLGLFVAGTGILIRAALFIQLFVIRDNTKRHDRTWVDRAFFASHFLILAGVVILLVRLVPTLIANHIQPGTDFIQLTWLGLGLVVAISILPALALYRTRKG